MNTLIIEEGPLRKNVVYTKVFAHLVYINQIIISAWLMFLWIDMLRLNQYWMMALITLLRRVRNVSFCIDKQILLLNYLNISGGNILYIFLILSFKF